MLALASSWRWAVHEVGQLGRGVDVGPLQELAAQGDVAGGAGLLHVRVRHHRPAGLRQLLRLRHVHAEIWAIGRPFWVIMPSLAITGGIVGVQRDRLALGVQHFEVLVARKGEVVAVIQDEAPVSRQVDWSPWATW